MARRNGLTAGTLSSAMTSSQNLLGASDLRLIALDQVVLDPHQIRDFMPSHLKIQFGQTVVTQVWLQFLNEFPHKAEGVVHLAASLRDVGLIHPIRVYEEGAGQYRLLVGERRYWAHVHALANGWSINRTGRNLPSNNADHIEAVVLREKPVGTDMMQLIENFSRHDLDPVDLALAIQRLQNELSTAGEGHVPLEQFSKEYLGMSSERRRQLLAILKLSPEAQQTLKDLGLLEAHLRPHLKQLLALSPEKQVTALMALAESLNKTASLTDPAIVQPTPAGVKATTPTPSTTLGQTVDKAFGRLSKSLAQLPAVQDIQQLHPDQLKQQAEALKPFRQQIEFLLSMIED